MECKKAVDCPRDAGSHATTMNETKWKAVGYARISTTTAKQISSLENQEDSIRAFVSRSGGEVIHFIREEVSGQDDAREGLKEALSLCKKFGCRLVVSRLDRLARSVSKMQDILNEQVEFTAIDFPHGSRMQFQLLAVFAEFEARTISERVSKSMKFLKSQGRTFGNPKMREVAVLGRQANRDKSLNYVREIKPLAEGLRNAGQTLKMVAGRLNDLKITTRYGKAWTEVAVYRLLKV